MHLLHQCVYLHFKTLLAPTPLSFALKIICTWLLLLRYILFTWVYYVFWAPTRDFSGMGKLGRFYSNSCPFKIFNSGILNSKYMCLFKDVFYYSMVDMMRERKRHLQMNCVFQPPPHLDKNQLFNSVSHIRHKSLVMCAHIYSSKRNLCWVALTL